VQTFWHAVALSYCIPPAATILLLPLSFHLGSVSGREERREASRLHCDHCHASAPFLLIFYACFLG